MSNFRWRHLVLLSFFQLCTFAYASEPHALLIGISDYLDPGIPDLKGPSYDLESMETTLSTGYGITDIRILKDAEATRTRILKSIEALEGSTGKGDVIFLYFSGYGTRSPDAEPRDGTGAIVLYDTRISGKTAVEIRNQMITARDLTPILSRLDTDRKLFIVFDSCHTETVVRTVAAGTGISRCVPLPNTNEPLSRLLLHEAPPAPNTYRNLIYLSATGNFEKAWDLVGNENTFDGKPHGALTEVLLRGMNGQADTNHDHVITYQELYEFARNNIKKAQTPQIRGNSGMDLPLFSQITPGLLHSAVIIPHQMRIRLDGFAGSKEAGLFNKIPGAELAQGVTYDLLVVRGSAYRFILPTGDVLFTEPDLNRAVVAARRYARMWPLLNLANAAQPFNVWFRAATKTGRAIFFEYDPVDFNVKSEIAAYFLLINIDPTGIISVLIPSPNLSPLMSGPGKELNLPEHGVIRAPFGAERFKVFAFVHRPVGLEAFVGDVNGVIDPLEERYSKFLSVISAATAGTDWAETYQMITTFPLK